MEQEDKSISPITYFKDYLKKLRFFLIGDNWRYEIKPISWYNFPQWLWDTFSEDWKRYKRRQRLFSFRRFAYFCCPNLKRPLFIVGAPRSGTTFLGECVAELPEISYHFEPVLTKAAARYVYEKKWSFTFSTLFFRWVYSWLMRIHFDGDLCFSEKTPQVSLVIPFLFHAFPDARFIHIVRDGRDSAISLSKKLWYQNRMKGSGAKEPGGYPLGPKARFWVEHDRVLEFETTNDLHRCVWLWRRYLEIISASLKNLPEGSVLEIKYEDLVKKPEYEATRILDFIGISDRYSKKIFEDYLVNNAIATSVRRWENELSPSQVKELESEAGECLKIYGYL